jgi:hypothetical protein
MVHLLQPHMDDTAAIIIRQGFAMVGAIVDLSMCCTCALLLYCFKGLTSRVLAPASHAACRLLHMHNHEVCACMCGISPMPTCAGRLPCRRLSWHCWTPLLARVSVQACRQHGTRTKQVCCIIRLPALDHTCVN